MLSKLKIMKKSTLSIHKLYNMYVKIWCNFCNDLMCKIYISLIMRAFFFISGKNQMAYESEK